VTGELAALHYYGNDYILAGPNHFYYVNGAFAVRARLQRFRPNAAVVLPVSREST
jgi:hypothetical protein